MFYTRKSVMDRRMISVSSLVELTRMLVKCLSTPRTTDTVPQNSPPESARHGSSTTACSFRLSLCLISMRSAGFEAHIQANITIDCQTYDLPHGI
jgi:hypothetical protein